MIIINIIIKLKQAKEQNQDVTRMMNRCAPMKMILKTCDIFTNTPSKQYIEMLGENFSQIEFEDKKDSSTFAASLPISVGF